ncbi:lytic transglycosylase, partial [Escherichia coli]|nr:lytic transglycosylase [Escherichia coli]
MKSVLLVGLLMLSSPVIAQDCFELAGRDYKIDPDLLRAISWKESRYRVNA